MDSGTGATPRGVGFGPFDADLVMRSAHDADAFGTLYDRHARDLLRSIARGGVAPSDCADLLAETFACAWIARSRYRDPGDGNARGWLFGIAKNLVRSYHRRIAVETRGRDRLRIAIEPVAVDERAAERLDALALRSELTDALAQLPDHQRSAVALRVLDGLRYAEIAAELGCTQIAARKRVSQGLLSLRQQLEEGLQ